MFRDYSQQYTRGRIGTDPSLLPVTERRGRKTEFQSKLGLAQSHVPTDLRHVYIRDLHPRDSDGTLSPFDQAIASSRPSMIRLPIVGSFFALARGDRFFTSVTLFLDLFLSNSLQRVPAQASPSRSARPCSGSPFRSFHIG